MIMTGKIFLILMIASYGSSQSLLYSSPMKSSQDFQRQSLKNYYHPPLRYPKRQNLFGNEAVDRWLIHDNGKEGTENSYIYGNKRQLKFEESRNRPTIKKNVEFGRESRYKRKYHQPLELFVRPQHPRRPAFEVKKATYDVLQVECPKGDDGLPRFACPSSDRMGRYRCITNHQLCDGFIDCPMAEDEDPQSCMFYKMTKAQINFLAEVLLRWLPDHK